MKHLPTKDRRAERQEFAYRYRVEILALSYRREKLIGKRPFTMQLSKEETALIDKARNELGYSCHTNDYDILISITKTLKQLLTCRN